MVEIRVKKTSPDAILPKKNNTNSWTGDAGFDLFAIEDVYIPPRGSVIVNVGLQLAYVTPGYWFRIEPRSGLGFKKGLQPHLGIIDNGYRGDLGVKIYNFSASETYINKGQGVAQLIAYKMLNTVVLETEEIDNSTDRGAKGFGSSDVD